MDIKELFDQYSAKVADVQHYRMLTESAADREFQYLLAQKKLLATSDSVDMTVSSHCMFFREAATKRVVFYGSRHATAEEEILALVRHTNRQRQWFLAECYELFEEFLNRAYAYMGFQNPALWPPRDFGGILREEVAAQDYEWFLGQARKTKTRRIMRHFREVLPRLRRVEANNRLDADLFVATTLIGEMRHKIVHERGVIPDKRQFAGEVLDKIGYSGGSSREEQLKFIEETLLVSDGAILLLNVPLSGPWEHESFNALNNYLLAYAHAIRSSLPTILSIGSDSSPTTPDLESNFSMRHEGRL